MTKFLLFAYLSFMTIYAYLLTQNRLDAIAEGIECEVIDQSIDFKDYLTRNTFNTWFEDDAAQKSYFSLWESINGRPSLESNPWVWVIEFKRIEK